jgi:uncharacterized membrane protein
MSELTEAFDRLEADVGIVVHPLLAITHIRAQRSTFDRFSDRLADHIVAWAGTMAFFYILTLMLILWPAYQSVIGGNSSFDPYPYSFLFFILGGIMQSLFVPTVMVSQNRAAQRDAVKAEADHRTMVELVKINRDQLEILQRLDAIERGLRKS